MFIQNNEMCIYIISVKNHLNGFHLLFASHVWLPAQETVYRFQHGLRCTSSAGAYPVADSLSMCLCRPRTGVSMLILLLQLSGRTNRRVSRSCAVDKSIPLLCRSTESRITLVSGDSVSGMFHYDHLYYTIFAY